MGQNYGIPCKYVWQPRTDPNLGEPNRALSLAPRPWFSKSQGEPGGWSRRRESNPHGTKYHWILSPARLPVPPLRVKNSNYHARCSHSRHHVVSQLADFHLRIFKTKACHLTGFRAPGSSP